MEEKIKPEVTVYFSCVDGTCIVNIDTPDMLENAAGPIIRVYLNDAEIFENPVYPGKVE